MRKSQLHGVLSEYGTKIHSFYHFFAFFLGGGEMLYLCDWNVRRKFFTNTIKVFFMENKKKKSYVIPSMEVVELELQGSLLAGSGTTELEGDFEDVNSYGGGDFD